MFRISRCARARSRYDEKGWKTNECGARAAAAVPVPLTQEERVISACKDYNVGAMGLLVWYGASSGSIMSVKSNEKLCKFALFERNIIIVIRESEMDEPCI